MIFTVVFCVDELVECIKVRGGSAVDVVPPVANKELLIEDGLPGTQKAILTPVVVAIVIRLKLN